MSSIHSLRFRSCNNNRASIRPSLIAAEELCNRTSFVDVNLDDEMGRNPTTRNNSPKDRNSKDITVCAVVTILSRGRNGPRCDSIYVIKRILLAGKLV